MILSPQENYTVFDNNAIVIFSCSGNGYAVSWVLNGSAYNTSHEQRGIKVVLNMPIGGVASSTVHIPASSTNNNTMVMCSVIDSTFKNVQYSETSILIIQGE